jgi:glycosyltransferase involved in cell wall biosynthesis
MQGTTQQGNHKQGTQASKGVKICFVALTAYPLLTGGKPKYVVGPDVNSFILAKELVKRGFQVSFITYDYGGAPVEYASGMEIVKTYREGSHLNKVLKAFHIWKAIKKVKARVYVHSGSLCISLFCRLLRKKNIYEVASDALTTKELIDPKSLEFHRPRFSLTELFHQLDIKLADIIIVQNEFQREMLKQNYHKDGILIKMPFPICEQDMPEKKKPLIVLWVGSMADVKQPELFLKMAEAIPEAEFQMIGGYTSSNQELYRKIRRESQRISNLEFLGPIPFYEVNRYFKRASLLVNTSKFEGFPHAFIQAWMHSLPVVSLNADPDEIICKYKLGFHSKNFNQLVKDVKNLLRNEPPRDQMGENAREYVEREHDIRKTIKKYIEIFKKI